MKLERNNLVVREAGKGFYRLQIMMTNESGNYLHTQVLPSINDALLIRDLLLEQEINQQDITISEHEKYFRIDLSIKDVNGTEYFFHSRKMNIIDVIFERDELLE